MIAWCSYCQQFVGELPPYEHLATTHILCSACESTAEDFLQADLEHAQVLKAVQNRLSEAGWSGDLLAAKQIIDAAGDYNLRPVDILMGIVAPALYQIGEDWRRGVISVAEEHRFTAFCEDVFELVACRMVISTADSETHPGALLVDAPGNCHTLGGRILGLWLASKGIHVRVTGATIDSESLANLVRQSRPSFLLISMALAEQTPGVTAIVESVADLPEPIRPRVVIGGFAVKQGMVPDIPGAELVTDISALAQMIAQGG